MKIDLTKQTTEDKKWILSNLFNEKYGAKLGEFNNTTGTERVNQNQVWVIKCIQSSLTRVFCKQKFWKGNQTDMYYIWTKTFFTWST